MPPFEADVPAVPAAPPLPPRVAARLRALLQRSFAATRLTDAAAGLAARQWADAYRGADAAGRLGMLKTMLEVGATRPAMAGRLPGPLWRALPGSGARFCHRLRAMPDGLAFVLALRADMLQWRGALGAPGMLETEIEELLADWFDAGLLELRLIEGPTGRRCAFFHPYLPATPVFSLDVTFCRTLPAGMRQLRDAAVPPREGGVVPWAVLHSLAVAMPGLRGVGFGNFAVGRLIQALRREAPGIGRFGVLAPLSGFSDWLAGRMDVETAGSAGLRLAAHYLAEVRDGRLPHDPLARFHLANGARIERVNRDPDADAGGEDPAGTCPFTVNYRYDPAAFEPNLALLAQGRIPMAPAVARLLEPPAGPSTPLCDNTRRAPVTK
ncbi:hypothetical protein GCM10023144_30430 [Pigmentiphaga soli]|uniref:Malonyl-CoA decarboxylase n=1 Tax=Pigmentiphaga soli TaxID=1007095 RepID=A0ABP8H9H8_9BURK